MTTARTCPSPGAYLRQHRQAVGLSIEAVARQVFLNPVDADAAAEALRSAEDDHELLGDADLARLAGVTRIDPKTYLRLVAAPCR